MNNRIIELIKAENLTAIKFAERLDVQPSNISHIISGRNKPGYDFIVKVLERFPTINPDWLLLGKGSMYKSNSKAQVVSNLENNNPKVDPSDLDYIMSTGIEELSERPLQKIEETNLTTNNSGKSVVKIILFYSDNTFEVFNGRK